MEAAQPQIGDNEAEPQFLEKMPSQANHKSSGKMQLHLNPKRPKKVTSPGDFRVGSKAARRSELRTFHNLKSIK